MIKVYKYLNDLPPQEMKLKKITFDLTNVHLFETQNPRTKL